MILQPEREAHGVALETTQPSHSEKEVNQAIQMAQG